ALAAIGAQVKRIVLRLSPPMIAQVRRPVGSAVVPRPRALDLDDIRAHIGKHLGSQRPGQNPAHIENAQARQRLRRLHDQLPAFRDRVLVDSFPPRPSPPRLSVLPLRVTWQGRSSAAPAAAATPAYHRGIYG